MDAHALPWRSTIGRFWFRVAPGLLAAAVVSDAARRVHALTPGGAIAATTIGCAVLAGSGIRGGLALVAFFVSSSLLGRLPTSQNIEQRRGNERDAVQVFANGGVAAILALAAAGSKEQSRPLLLAGFGGAVATAAADTWATEIGSRSRHQPRSIVTWRPVTTGTSGGVTWAGLAASAAGAALIAGLAPAGSGRQPGHAPTLAIPVALGGFAGAVADSILGATVQEVRFCDACARESERRLHRCGAPTRPLRGAAWCDNDTVNAIATMVGAATAVAIHSSRRAYRRLAGMRQ